MYDIYSIFFMIMLLQHDKKNLINDALQIYICIHIIHTVLGVDIPKSNNYPKNLIPINFNE